MRGEGAGVLEWLECVGLNRQKRADSGALRARAGRGSGEEIGMGEGVGRCGDVRGLSCA